MMDRGGEEAIRRMEQEASDQLVKKLGEQMSELFANLAVKQEEENRRLKEENQQMQRQLVEQNNRMEQQSNRMEQMMGLLLRQMDGEQSGSPASTEVTPEKGNKAAVVMPPLPGAEGPSSLEKKTRPATRPNGQLDAEEVAEVMRSNLAMKEALKDFMAQGAGMAQFMQARGHHEVVGMIESGGVTPPGAQ